MQECGVIHGLWSDLVWYNTAVDIYIYIYLYILGYWQRNGSYYLGFGVHYYRVGGYNPA